MKKRKINAWLLPFAVAALLFFGGLLLLFHPVPAFSATENRLLAEQPTFSFQSLIGGDYTAAWERYTAERLCGRDALRGLHALVELLLGKRESGGVMLLRDNSLAARPVVNTTLQNRNIAAIDSLYSTCHTRGLPFYIGIVPYRAEARAAVLPSGYTPTATKELLTALEGKADSAVAFTAIINNEEWFRTDHHWTAAGAYRAYCTLGALLGYEPYGETDFEKVTVSTSFFGTGARAAGIPHVSPDSITLWRYTSDNGYHLQKEGRCAVFEGFYDLEKCNTGDGYAVFLGGNDGVLTIDTATDAAPRETLLLWRDSYAAALLPFLARHYRIIAVDPRYYRGDTAALLARADKVLLLAGAVTLSESPFPCNK